MNQYRETKEVICSFLNDLIALLESPDFNLEKNFMLGGKHEREKNTKTLLELDMDRGDVVNVLKNLTVSNYYHSFSDDKNANMPNFHVFFVSISEKEIYIKVRIQNVKNVLCISFHFSEYSHGKMPY